MGELVSLFALVYIAEKTGSEHPWIPALGILAAFFLPTVLLSDEAVRALRHWFGGPDLASHWLAGSLGVVMCYASYGAVLFIERAEEDEDEKLDPRIAARGSREEHEEDKEHNLQILPSIGHVPSRHTRSSRSC